MTFVSRLTPSAAAVLLLASCGGGGDSSPPAPVVVSSSGFAVDGYLSGAAVLCDSNGNGVADAGEISVTTNSSGGYSFPAGCSAALTARGGVSVDTGVPFTGVLKAPAGSSVITPLTTLLAEGLSQVQLKAALGLPAGIDLQTVDPALKTNGVLNNAALFKQTLALQQLLQKSTELITGLAGASADASRPTVYSEVAASFANSLKTGAALGSDNTINAAVVSSLVQAAAMRVGTAAAVAAEVKTALAKVNALALAVISAGGLKAQAELIL